MDPQTDAALIDELRQHGLRATGQRLAILRALREDRTHPSAEELFDKLKSRYATLSLSTVYKSLQTLAERGVVQTIDGGTGRQRFEGQPKPHHHAVCVVCGRVIDIPYDAYPIGPHPRHVHAEFVVHNVKVYFTGRCQTCVRASAVEPVD
jgi:Fe2+ or Zn2+ uptake regulation protein